jgi:SAM-dependent methyltransferase
VRSQLPSHFIQIDEEGYFQSEQTRISDPENGRTWLASVHKDEQNHLLCDVGGVATIVEPFDEPFVALDIEQQTGLWSLTMPYGHRESFDPKSITVDEWDRFHGRTSRGIAFVLSRAAQARFFDLLDSFDDDSVVIDGQRSRVQPWLQENLDTKQNEFWTNIYRTETPRWELEAPSHALPSLVPRLRLQRCRICVAGAGSGNDAAWFAEQGHIVTAIDFSEEAIARAKSKYGRLPDLKFLQADVFNLPAEMSGTFDIVFEHTLYCAITPSRRNELVRVWRRLLTDQGHLMGVFFAFDKPTGPPFGGSEWELRARLSKQFQPLYWNRLRDSRPNRLGHEVFIYAQKKAMF